MKRSILKLICILQIGVMALAPAISHACSSFTLKEKDGNYVYARTMEFGKSLDEKLLMFPRNYQYKGVGTDGVVGSGLNWTGKYAAVGVNAFGLDLLVDGMNEKGMSGGMLNQPNFAQYQDPKGDDAKNSIASYQTLIWILSNFATTDEVKAALPKIFVNSASLGQWKGVVKIHLTLHDTNGKSITIEYLGGKLVITDNPSGVMANDPPMSWQFANLGNYINLSPVEKPPVKLDGQTFLPPSSGSGLHGLPGDFLSTSRFLRAFIFSQAAQKYAADQPKVETAWHIINMFDIPPGAIMIPAGDPYAGGEAGWEKTQESIVVDSKNLAYYVRPFGGLNIKKFNLKDHDLNSKTIKVWDLKGTTTYETIK